MCFFKGPVLIVILLLLKVNKTRKIIQSIAPEVFCIAAVETIRTQPSWLRSGRVALPGQMGLGGLVAPQALRWELCGLLGQVTVAVALLQNSWQRKKMILAVVEVFLALLFPLRLLLGCAAGGGAAARLHLHRGQVLSSCPLGSCALHVTVCSNSYFWTS